MRDWAVSLAKSVAGNATITATIQTRKSWVLGARAKAGFPTPDDNLWCAGFVSAIAAYTDQHFGTNVRLFDSPGANTGKAWSMNIKDAQPGIAVRWKIYPQNGASCRNGGHIAFVVGVDSTGIWTVGGNEGNGKSTKSQTQGGGIMGPKHITWAKVETRASDADCPCRFSGYVKIFPENDDTLRKSEPAYSPDIIDTITKEKTVKTANKASIVTTETETNTEIQPESAPEIDWSVYMKYIGSTGKLENINTDADKVKTPKNSKDSAEIKDNPEILAVSKSTMKQDKMGIETFKN